jgi:transcriptional regulator with XRE-family HTH domain
MSFGTRLTEARKKKLLTQEGLGKGLGTDGKDASKAVVYGWEKDQHFPRVDQLAMICQRLEVSADYLLFGTIAESALLPEVATVAAEVNSFPPKHRRVALAHIRQILDLVNETLQATDDSLASNTEVDEGQAERSLKRSTGR